MGKIFFIKTNFLVTTFKINKIARKNGSETINGSVHDTDCVQAEIGISHRFLSRRNSGNGGNFSVVSAVSACIIFFI